MQSKTDDEAPPIEASPLSTSSSKNNHARYNVILMALALCVVFAAFNTTQAFMTTINKTLGYISLATLYGTFSLSNFLAPMIELRMGPRLTLCIGAMTYALYVFAAIAPETVVLISSSVVIGIGASLLWTAQGHFLSLNSNPENVGSNSGAFWSIFMVNSIIGNLLAAFLIRLGYSNGFVFTVLFFLALVGIAMLLFLREARNADVHTVPTTKIILMSVLKLYTEKYFLLFVGMFTFCGISQGFLFGRFPPMLGKDWIGFVMAAFGVAECLGSMIYGKLADLKSFGSVKCIVLASILWMITLIGVLTMDLWNPYSYFATAVVMGLADAGYNTQISAILTSVYSKDNRTAPAFAGMKFTHSLFCGLAMLLGAFVEIHIFCVVIAVSCVICLVMLYYANKMASIAAMRSK